MGVVLHMEKDILLHQFNESLAYALIFRVHENQHQGFIPIE